MFVASEMSSILLNNYYYLMYRVGTRIQAVLTAAVYRKTLSLSNAARREKTVGEIVNLMAIDVDRFQMVSIVFSYSNVPLIPDYTSVTAILVYSDADCARLVLLVEASWIFCHQWRCGHVVVVADQLPHYDADSQVSGKFTWIEALTGATFLF